LGSYVLSLLLAYTDDKRHWSVFSASIATVLVFWGITPSQAGIFATDTSVVRTTAIPFVRSTSYLSLSQQKESLSSQSAHSVAAIMWLNETLQPFMTPEFVLAPFGARDQLDQEIGNRTSEVWSGFTQRYSVNITCEEPVTWNDTGIISINSTWGCSFLLPPARTLPSTNDSKVFDTLYVGYSNVDGNADFYLGATGICPKNESHTFLIQWSKALIPTPEYNALPADQKDEHANVTTRWCRSTYYVQDVQAAVSMPERAVISYQTLGDPRPLPADLFNSTDFEAAMSMGHDRLATRTDFPTALWPNQQSFLANTPLNLAYLPKMTPFAIGAFQKPMDEYLDSSTLDQSYQSAYRLLFARHMSDVLSSEFDKTAVTTGHSQYTTQAIILVPAFTYVVTGFLALTIFLALILLYSSWVRTLSLHADPATISATMTMVSEDENLLSAFKSLDRSSNLELDEILAQKRFELTKPRDSIPSRLILHQGSQTTRNNTSGTVEKLSKDEDHHLVDGVQPLEFKLRTGFVFFSLQVLLFALIPVFFWATSTGNGTLCTFASPFTLEC
jgi:hypothetical protein